MTDSSKISKNLKNPNYTIGKSGKKVFAKGNQIGRMPKKGFNLTDLTKLVIEYDKTQDVTLLEHYVQQLRKDNRLLDKYMDRYVPTKSINELTGPGGRPLMPTTNILIEKTYLCPLREKGECPLDDKLKELEKIQHTGEMLKEERKKQEGELENDEKQSKEG